MPQVSGKVKIPKGKKVAVNIGCVGGGDPQRPRTFQGRRAGLFEGEIFGGLLFDSARGESGSNGAATQSPSSGAKG
jgi:hypothetical protein